MKNKAAVGVVLPRRTSHSPMNVHIGEPGLFLPQYKSINISCVFTWDIPLCLKLKESWEDRGIKTSVGGPAFDDPGGEFTPGLYIKNGITITSRGCSRNCPWCYVPKREGKIRELKTIHPGNIIQDNNLLACSKTHIQKVFNMLQKQRAIRFVGGLDCRLLSDRIIDQLRGLKIKEIWIASDFPEIKKIVLKSILKLRTAGFPEYKIRCYVLAGFFNSDSPGNAEDRLQELRQAGSYPFVQLYDGQKNRNQWKLIVRKWSRPAAYNSGAAAFSLGGGTYHEY